MRYRIVKDENKNFFVQEKLSFFNQWRKINTYSTDYPTEDGGGLSGVHYKGFLNSSFSTLDLAKKKIYSLIEESEENKRKKILTVVYETKV